MARIFTDGAEFGDTLFWDYVQGANMLASTANKRSGNYAYKWEDNAYYSSKILSTAVSEGYLRFGFMIHVDTNPQAYRIVRWNNDTTELGSIRIKLSPRVLEAYVGTNLVATGTIPLMMDTWYLIEVHIKIHDSTGEITTKIDGTQDINFTGDTKPDTNTTFTNIYFYTATDWSVDNWYDDIAFNDTSGSVDNSWCGDGKVILLTPNANGDVSQLVGSDGNQTDNYLLVDDIPKDDDTTYVIGSGIGQYDLYNLTASSLTGAEILRVWPEGRARKTTADESRIALVIKTNSSEYDSNDLDLLTSYDNITGSGYRVNPQTGVEWTVAELDSLQVGSKIV